MASPRLLLLVLLGLAPLLAGQDVPASDEAAAPAAAPAETDVQPTLTAIFKPPRLLGVRPADLSVSADGRFCTYRWTAEDAEEPERDWWLAATDGSGARVIVPFEKDHEAHLTWTHQGSTLLLEQDGWLSLWDPATDEPPRPLFATGGDARVQLLDDDHRAVVQTGKDHELWVVDLQSGARRAPAADLTGRSAWFEVLEPAGRIALLADAPTKAPAADRHGDRTARDGGDADEHRGERDDARERDTRGDRADPDQPAPDRHLWLVDLGNDLRAGPGAERHEPRPPRSVPVPAEGRLSLAPDGTWALVQADDDGVERHLIVADYLKEQVTAVPVRGNLAGDPAPVVALTLIDLAEGTRHALPVDGADRFWVRGARWKPDGHLLLLDRISNDSHVRQVLVVDPDESLAGPVLSERDEAWIGGPFTWSAWSEDGARLFFTSERTGWEQLDQFALGAGEPAPLTEGAFEVRGARPIEGTGRLLLCCTAEDDPAAHQLELLDPSAGLSLRLTSEEGCVVFPRWGRGSLAPATSRDGTTIVYAWETLGVPADLYALKVTPEGDAGGLAVTAGPVRLTDTVPAALRALELPPPEIVTYTDPEDGATVHAYLYKPEPFDPQRQYPAVVFVHGAGQLQEVTRSTSAYDVNMLFHHRLARLGFVVLDPDFRHSNGYGRDFRAAVHGFMGGRDLDDVVAGVSWLGEQGFVDTTRVGIYGGSYGGFLTLMALFTKPDVFACGAALRSVTDWRTYNAWYTNPRLGTPQDDPEAYARSSPIDHVEGLKAPLLLLHGLLDDNVFAQDTIRLMEKLIQLGKDFDVMLYPSQKHGFTDPESWIDEYGRIERWFVRYLRPGGR